MSGLESTNLWTRVCLGILGRPTKTNVFRLNGGIFSTGSYSSTSALSNSRFLRTTYICLLFSFLACKLDTFGIKSIAIFYVKRAKGYQKDIHNLRRKWISRFSCQLPNYTCNSWFLLAKLNRNVKLQNWTFFFRQINFFFYTNIEIKKWVHKQALPPLHNKQLVS